LKLYQRKILLDGLADKVNWAKPQDLLKPLQSNQGVNVIHALVSQRVSKDKGFFEKKTYD
jgi:hypothetical protein